MRTLDEINKINNCNHNYYGNDNSKEQIEPYYKFGYKNCCICKNCGIGCGEEMNAPYLNNDLKIFKKGE